MAVVNEADLCIIIGTAMAVQPFSMLPKLINTQCDTLIMNMEPIKDYEESERLLYLLGPCDDSVKRLCASLGWDKDLETLIAKI